MFWLLVGSLMVSLVSSVRSSYRANREASEGWLLPSDPRIEWIWSEERNYQDLSHGIGEEACQEALHTLAV